MKNEYDVAIVGGGPAGSTVASLLLKYNPRLRVVVLERESFPRDHVGESQLPSISHILAEMGVWDKVEAAGFPIKIGATYRWGRTDDLWDFEFVAGGVFHPVERPSRFVGQRTQTAFQVDRAVYDKILLDHARELGCEVREETTVRVVERNGDRVNGLVLDDGSRVQARYYVDASGHPGIIRRTMEIPVEIPTSLQNMAVWDYWRNAEWAVSIGVGGTRVQVLSLSYGWIWFIPLGPDRTSIGLVVPVSYYKESGKRPEELYREALASDPIVSRLIRNAECEGRFTTTKDWSFIAERLAGQNWFLAGESAGFADPILAAGMALTHAGARLVAYTILELDRKEMDAAWLRENYSANHRSQIRQHVRFADFWYTANGVFSDLKDYAQEIAGDAGLSLSPEEAWRWIGQGGFIEHTSGTNLGGCGLLIAKEIVGSFTGGEVPYDVVGKTHFVTDLDGAEKDWMAETSAGRITRRRMYRRNGKVLPMVGLPAFLTQLMKIERSYDELCRIPVPDMTMNGESVGDPGKTQFEMLKTLEALVSDGWIKGRVEPGAVPFPPVNFSFEALVHANRDVARLEQVEG
ncbi:MAG: NAD(P)/FAD-dependent oxidoreductase [Fimbriimonas sp.]|nr:NAD(P)/FAD-dependent oxidoreductase [Fimbriimonas sp.]